jgi:hypothetical protein
LDRGERVEFRGVAMRIVCRLPRAGNDNPFFVMAASRVVLIMDFAHIGFEVSVIKLWLSC